MQPTIDHQNAEAEHEMPAYAATMKIDEIPAPAAYDLNAVVDETVAREKASLQIRMDSFSFQQRRAKMFAVSGLFAVKGVTVDTAIAIAMVKIELGEALGFGPAEALQYIHVINGVTSISAAARAARMQLAGYSWDIDLIGGRDKCEGCTIWLKYRGKTVVDRNGQPVSESFTKADATAMLTTVWDDKTKSKRRCSILEKDNWKMSPRNMYFARAITNTQRFYAPGVLNPSLLSTEEAMDIDVVDARPVGSVDLGDIKAGAAKNNGHDATGADQFRATDTKPEPSDREVREAREAEVRASQRKAADAEKAKGAPAPLTEAEMNAQTAAADAPKTAEVVEPAKPAKFNFGGRK